MTLKNTSRSLFLWILIFAVSLFLRYWYSSTELCFYTDQSRDAIVANQILQGEWKVFGPVVSGRGAVFHGVLYYYVIAPLYALGGGSPLFVSVALSLISTVGLIPTYLLAEKILKNKKLAFIVIGMMGVSLSSIETSASFWNLQLSIILLPAYCLFLFKTSTELNFKNSFLTGLFLGLLIQSGFSNIVWILPYVVLFGFLLIRRSNKRKTIKNSVVSLIGLGIATSTMILVEFLAWRRGLFALEDSLHWVSGSGFSLQNLQSVFIWYFNSISSFLVPQLPLVTMIIIVISSLVIFNSRKDHRWLWLGLLLLPPIGGQLASNGAASYILTGYESIFYIFVVLVFSKAFSLLGANHSSKKQQMLIFVLLTIFAVSNVAKLKQDKMTRETLACVWKATNLEELDAIDYTYDRADGAPFSIDVVAEPYGINMKYGYLYSWYGQKNYGYMPVFIGGSQVGHPTEGLLQEAQNYSDTHFIIYEPGSYNYWFKVRTADAPATRESQNLFYYRQPALENLQETRQFGELITVDYYFSQLTDN
ncbi:MAG: transmembrane(s)proteins 7..24 [Microgenomates bacterium 39_7]|nr:MAG: transmembrane(s)proteins 7..24 [Microgenomates bacterium 39_7]